MKSPHAYTITFRPEPDIDPIRALRALLKYAGRAGLRCTSIKPEPPDMTDHDERCPTCGRPTVERWAVLDLWQRASGIFAAVAGLRIEIRPIENPGSDGPHHRLYISRRVQGLGRDQANPTRATPQGWAMVRARQSAARTMAAIGMFAAHTSRAEQRELGLEPEE